MDGVITINNVRSMDNLVDPLTKRLGRERVSTTSRRMGLNPMEKKNSSITDTQPV